MLRDELLEKAHLGLDTFINFVENDFNLSYEIEEDEEDAEETYEIYYDNKDNSNEFVDSYTFDEDGNYCE